MNLGRETEVMEFKKSTSELKEAIISLAAMLNKNRAGVIYFGVSNSGDIVGQMIGSDTTREISKRIYESLKPIPTIEISILKSNKFNYIKVSFQGSEQPYAAYGRYYLRVADEDREMTQSQLKSHFNKMEPTYEMWERKESDITLEQIDEALIKKLYNQGIQSKRFSEEFTNLKDVLSKLKLMDGENINNAGSYLFSKSKPITLKLALFATDQKLTFLDQNHFQGNIYECIEEAIVFISKHMRWKAEIGEITRVDIPEIPTRAIREVVINSFAHARYEGGFVYHEINIFPSKITIFNPGHLSTEINPILDAKSGTTKSIIKNPLIANALFRTNMIEAFGTGFTRVFELCNDSSIKYEFGNLNRGFEFRFIRTPDVLKEIENVLKELNGTEVLVYQLLKNDGNLNSLEIAERIGKNQKTILRVFVSLQEKGYLKRIGGRKTGYWKVSE